jgi:hypothetical protein
MKLTGAAILVSRGIKVLQAAPAAYPYRSGWIGRRGGSRVAETTSAHNPVSRRRWDVPTPRC